MDTMTATHAGSDLLSGILGVEIRNEEKITANDRLYCEAQQEALYKSLEQIERWYGIFTGDAEKYIGSHKVKYKENGEVSFRESLYPNDGDYAHCEFRPFKSINAMVSANLRANRSFASRIVGYFNRTYNVAVPVPEINGDTLRIGFRPEYMTYVDTVIEHLGGRSFRQTAVDELLRRFHKIVKPGPWSKSGPELKGDKITFPDVVSFDDFYYSNWRKNQIHYNYHDRIPALCEGIAYGADDLLCGDRGVIVRFNTDDVDTAGWYDLTTTNATGMKFYRNGRVDVRFINREAASSCYNRLRLDELTVRQ